MALCIIQVVEVVILYSAQSANDAGRVLRDAAEIYKVDVAAITAKVKQEFAANSSLIRTRLLRVKTK